MVKTKTGVPGGKPGTVKVRWLAMRKNPVLRGDGRTFTFYGFDRKIVKKIGGKR